MSWPLTLLASRPWALDGVKIRIVSSPQQTFIWLSLEKILGFFHSMTWEQVLLGKARPARDLLRLWALLWVDHAIDWVHRTTISKTSLKHFLWVFFYTLFDVGIPQLFAATGRKNDFHHWIFFSHPGSSAGNSVSICNTWLSLLLVRSCFFSCM